MGKTYRPTNGRSFIGQLAQEFGHRPTREPKRIMPTQRDLYTVQLEEQVRQLEAENAKLKSGNGGTHQRRNGLSDALSRFANGITLPGKN